jgi:hypothetical protein
MWDTLTAAGVDVHAYSITRHTIEPYQEYTDSDTDAAVYPGDPLPLHAEASANTPRASAWSSARVRNNQAALWMTAFEAEDGEWMARGDAAADSWLEWEFHLEGGTGSTAVEIPFTVRGATGADSDVICRWTASVVGVGDVSGEHYGGMPLIDEDHAWTGVLNYGQTYRFRAGVSAEGASEEGFLLVDDYRIGLPVPEPATLLLLGLGLAGAAFVQLRRRQ